METYHFNIIATAAPKPIRVQYWDGTSKEFDVPANGEKLDIGAAHTIKTITTTECVGNPEVSLGTLSD